MHRIMIRDERFLESLPVEGYDSLGRDPVVAHS